MPEGKNMRRQPGDHRTIKEREQYVIGYDAGEREGIRGGVDKVRKFVLDYLETQYMAKGVERGTPKGEAILELTRNLSQAMKDAGF